MENLDNTQRWSYERGYWPQLEEYISMVQEIVKRGFELTPLSLDKLEFAYHLALEVLNDKSNNLTSDDRQKLLKLIGDTGAILDNFGRGI